MDPYTFVAHGRPKSKDRPRMTRRGRTYTPAKTTEAEIALVEQYEGPVFDGPIRVEVKYEKDAQVITIVPLGEEHHSKLTADIDNLLKLTLDALQREGGAYTNDRQVVELGAVKGVW
jgi:Holliday junction resolvase RusA-like endonuclease